MEIKYTVQGLLVYIALEMYVLAFLAALARRPRIGRFFYQLGFVMAVICFGYRWWDVRHVPFQNMFEVFLSMSVAMYPLSVVCRRSLRVGGETADMMIAAILLFPAGFIFSAEPLKLPPALQSWLFVPHVAVYLLAYVMMAKAAVQATLQLYGRNDASDELVSYEDGTYRMVCLGFPLLTLGLVLGSLWGKLAWGDYWGWDPKELWSLASWLAYVGYLHFRCMFGRKHARINSAWAIMGIVMILITLLWANLSKIFSGLHNYAT
jgi:ABC-type transport system involved in cytochrome c biogenesis permease subunit